MKKFLTASVLSLMAVFFIALPVYADGIIVEIDGQAIVFEDQAPVLIDGNVLIPVRGVFEQLGFEVEWDEATSQATLTGGSYTVVLAIGSSTFITNGVSRSLDAPVQLIGGRTMLPINAVLESVGYYFDWDSVTRTVAISTVSLYVPAPQEDEVPDEMPDEIPYYLEAFVIIRGQPVYRYSYWQGLNAYFLGLEDPLTNEDILPLIYFAEWLSFLNLSGNQISDITPLADLPNLVTLHMWDNQVSDLTPLAGLTNLETMFMWNNQISDLTPLAGLTNLAIMYMWANPISDLSPLSELTNLNRLIVSGGGVSDVSPLAELTNLVALGVGGNQITDISPLAGLTNLTNLYLDGDQITDISPLAGLTNLTTLNLEGNQITDISTLAGLTNLTFVNLEGNPITDWSPVDHVEEVIGRPE